MNIEHYALSIKEYERRNNTIPVDDADGAGHTGVCHAALRLYKKKWQPRMAMLLVPLLANAILYAIYETTPFFYLGVILLLCIPFVWPRKSA